jgi:hypothetical protein
MTEQEVRDFIQEFFIVDSRENPEFERGWNGAVARILDELQKRHVEREAEGLNQEDGDD